MPKPSILVVDDDAFFRTFCTEILREAGYTVAAAASGREALEHVGRDEPSLILADIYMPELTGLELLETVKAHSPSVDVIIMTGYASIDTAIQALKRGAADYLRKPFAAEELTTVVEGTLAQRRLYQENARLRNQLELYEVTRSFASIEEPSRVLDLGLEALIRVSGCGAGLCLLSGTDLQFMALAHQRGMGAQGAENVRLAFVSGGLQLLRNLRQIQTVGRTRLAKILEGAGQQDLGECLLIPMTCRGALEGAFLLFRDDSAPRFAAGDAENAQFVGRQVELSYESALRVQEARQQAFIDALTDLYNARYLDTALEKNIAEAERLGSPFSLLFLDLDYFKEINDAYGHLVGGKVLIEVSRILKGHVREEDVVIRYGGDEFTVVLPRTDATGAKDVAERIRQAIKDHNFLGREGRSIRITTSIGVATYPDNAKTREELLDQADRAMYRGKEAARDVVYSAHAH